MPNVVGTDGENRLLVLAIAPRIYRETFSGTNLTDVQQYLNGTDGRLRTVEPAPDGGLGLISTNNGEKDSVAINSTNEILRVRLSG